MNWLFNFFNSSHLGDGQPPPVSNIANIIIIAGQSNCGRASAADLPTELKAPMPNAKIWTGNTTKWEPLEAGVNSGINTGQFGPEVKYAQLYNQNKGPLYLIKLGVGASFLASSGKTTDWLPSANESFASFEYMINQAIIDLKINAKVPNILGLVWMQGEEDATDQAASLAYQSNLSLLTSAIRGISNVNDANLPIIIGRINGIDDPSEVYRGNVRAAQSAYVSGDANAYLIDTDGYPLQDSVHYNYVGQQQFGQDIYDVMVLHNLI